MAEYIEREVLIRELKDEIKECGDAHISDRPIAYGTILGLKGALSYAKALPSADVVEVVRCKDCKHLRVINSETLYAYCPKTEYSFLPFETDTRTHFCSYGKKKEGAEE